MGAHLNRALEQFERIQYDHDHGGTVGHSVRHMDELSMLYRRSHDPTRKSGDRIAILRLVEKAAAFIQAMKEREQHAKDPPEMARSPS